MVVKLKFDINKIIQLVSNKSLSKDNITDEEYEFMRNIYNFIIDSEDYETSIRTLAIMHELKESEVKQIRNIYFSYLATEEEKAPYYYMMEQTRNQNKKSKGFVNISIIISLLILLLTFGIYLGYILYNLI